MARRKHTKTKATIIILAVTAIALLLFTFSTPIPLSALLVTFAVIIALYRIIPSRFDSNFFIFEIMLGAGFALAVVAQNSSIQIPGWAMWVWIGISVTISIVGPIPLRKFSSSSFH